MARGKKAAGGANPAPAAPAVKPWKADDDVHNLVRTLIGQYHPDLALVSDEILVIFKEKATVQGTNIVRATTAKAPAIVGIVSDIPYKYVITIGADAWDDLTDRQKVALLDRQLCACRAAIDDTTGDAKYTVVPPEMSFYRGELERHGFWATTGVSADVATVSHIFG